ncbi:MAG: S-layer homology domain-containing protein [Oscillospiraceae bacterium]|nr:S-layer homology domain-containing protein [Oscillospiraceae bacterium]
MKTKGKKALSAILTFALVFGLFTFALLSAGAIEDTPAFAQISAGQYHSAALDVDGNIWTWGWNLNGQLGDGTTMYKDIPAQIDIPRALVKFVQVSAGGMYTMALDANGSIWAWGANESGQLGDGSTTFKTTPMQIPSNVRFTQVSAGGAHTMALDSEGRLWAWGFNESGQLGDGTTTLKSAPMQISFNSGQLGDGTNTLKTTQQQILSNVRFTQVSAGFRHTMAIDSEGRLWAWGDNYNGQLGDGTTTNRTVPVQIATKLKFTQVSAGGPHTTAIDTDGNLWTWGYNYNGQLGDGTNDDTTVPKRISTEATLTQVAAGGGHTVVLDRGGRLWSWGWNSFGQLGDGTTENKNTPVLILGKMRFKQVAAGGNAHTVALDFNGNIWAWGWNNYGQVGDGTSTDRNVPVQITGMSIAEPTIETTEPPTTGEPEPTTDLPTEPPEPTTEEETVIIFPYPPEEFYFIDVSESEWYYSDVKIAWQLGLISGKSDTSFAPGDNLTYAEAVKLAACMHQLYTEGKVTLVPRAGEWYDAYVAYAKKNGIINKDYAWGTPATRAGYMEIFASALPDEALAAINTIPGGSIPDVPMAHAQAGAIYKLYRAGILQGVDPATHECNPASTIRRSEVAAILTRMMNPEKRVKFSMV